jgi:hypothetical protein
MHIGTMGNEAMSKKGQKCKVVKLLPKDKEMMVPAPQPMIFVPICPYRFQNTLTFQPVHEKAEA